MNKQQIIFDFSTEQFFKQNILDFKRYPDENVADYFSNKTNKYTCLNLSSLEAPLMEDMMDLFKCIMVNEEPYRYTSDAFRYMFLLPEFMKGHGYTCFSDISDVEKATKEWISFLKKEGLKSIGYLKNIVEKAMFTIMEYKDTRTGLDRNYWRMDELAINNERLDKSKSLSGMNFWKFRADDREYYKMYFRHLLADTELSYSTIFNHYSILRNFSNKVRTPILEITHDEICDYASQYKNDRKNKILSQVKNMIDYLSTKGIYNGRNPISKKDFAKERIKYVHNTVPENVFIEFFKHIQELPPDLLLMFLIDAFAGIRISDICQLGLDCLYQNEHGYFIFHSVQKMQDVGGIPISKELYDMIQKRIDYIKALDYEETYLFPSVKKRNHPYICNSYMQSMKRYTKAWGIKSDDGEIYNFVTHAFRHTISTELYNMGMSPTLIQLGILHHTEINMSRHYIEINADTQRRIMKKIEPTATESAPEPADSVLPNGYCGMPAKLSCPNMNSCLTCQFFRTSIKFLDVHKEQLRQLKEQAEYFEKNNFKQNAVIAKKQISILETIIASLEEIKEDDDNG